MAATGKGTGQGGRTEGVIGGGFGRRNRLKTWREAEVNSDLEAVQFTITDVGSAWKSTKATYKNSHKGKTKTVESTIGIKLSKELAKQKGKDEWGDEPLPKEKK